MECFTSSNSGLHTFLDSHTAGQGPSVHAGTFCSIYHEVDHTALWDISNIPTEPLMIRRISEPVCLGIEEQCRLRSSKAMMPMTIPLLAEALRRRGELGEWSQYLSSPAREILLRELSHWFH